VFAEEIAEDKTAQRGAEKSHVVQECALQNQMV
jgi:hypothetical protein